MFSRKTFGKNLRKCLKMLRKKLRTILEKFYKTVLDVIFIGIFKKCCNIFKKISTLRSNEIT